VVLHELVTNLLYRPDGLGLNRKGRTRSALVIGLGDDDASVYRRFVGQSTRCLTAISIAGVSTSKTTFLVYGQTKVDDGDPTGPRVLDLLAAKRKIRPPPNKAVVRPGDPLPRRKTTPSLFHANYL